MSFIVGLTGGIGSGKSAASDWFAKQGIDIIDADLVAREVVAAGQPALQQIKTYFGDWVVLENGELNRSQLRAHVFEHPEDRTALERITHPAIRKAILQQLNHSHSDYTILVSPLLYETNQHQLTHRQLLIDASTETQLARASLRDGQPPQQIEKIIAAQMPRLQKQQLADDIVLNDGSLTALYDQLAVLHRQYLTQAVHFRA